MDWMWPRRQRPSAPRPNRDPLPAYRIGEAGCNRQDERRRACPQTGIREAQGARRSSPNLVTGTGYLAAGASAAVGGPARVAG